MDRAEGPGSLRRDGVKRGNGGEVLKGIFHLHGAAVRGGPAAEIAAVRLHHLPHLRLDDEHHLAEARPEGVVDGVLHENFPVGADAVHLLAAAVAGAQARRHNYQREFHGRVLLSFGRAAR